MFWLYWYINTIYYWIEQGAIGSDDDGWEDACVGGDEIEDCNGECVDENLLGDGNCDDGEDGEANFNCAQYIFDNTDCPVGVLEFGSYEFNNYWRYTSATISYDNSIFIFCFNNPKFVFFFLYWKKLDL